MTNLNIALEIDVDGVTVIGGLLSSPATPDPDPTPAPDPDPTPDPTPTPAPVVAGMRFKSASYSTCEDLSSPMNYLSPPTRTQGTEVATVGFDASSDEAGIKIQLVNAFGVHKTSNAALIAALFIDDEVIARQVVAVHPPGANLVVALPTLSFDWVPGDTDEHIYRIRVGGAGGVVRLNGDNAGAFFGGLTPGAKLNVVEGEFV